MKFAEYVKALRALAKKHDTELPLNKGATTAALAKAVRALGFQPDPALQEAWRFGNGSAEYASLFAAPGQLTGYEFLSLTQMLKERAGLERRAPQYAGYEEDGPRHPRLQPGWFHEGWVPFASFGGATMLLISDASPSKKGKQGQIIAFTHDPDEMTYIAPSFEALLKASLKMFKANPEDLFDLG